jgi:hypothetical protein
MPLARRRLRSAAPFVVAAAPLVAVRVARSLHSRWRSLPPPARARLEPLAEDAKERALELRGAADPAAAERELRAVSASLATALVETAEADPQLDPAEVEQLREELRSELDRLAGAEIRASRGTAADADRPAGADGSSAVV